MCVEFTGRGEELVEELGGAFHQHETAVFGTVGRIVEEALDSLHSMRQSVYRRSAKR